MATEHGGRVMHQPRKSVLRDTLAKAADTIAEKNAEIDRLVERLDVQTKKASVTYFLVGLFVGCVFTTLMSYGALHA